MFDMAAGSVASVCANIDELKERIEATLGALDIPGDASELLKCRFGGFVDGHGHRLQELMDSCGTSCEESGRSQGPVYGQFYCTIAVAARRPPNPGDYCIPPETTCGAWFREGCSAAYESYVAAWAECVPYSRHPHRGAYENYRDLACTYDIADR